MNVFEFNILASPVGGLVGGLNAAKGLSATDAVLAGGVGVGVGVGLYFGLFGLGWLVLRIAGLDKARDKKTIGRAGVVMGLIVLLPMLVLPILSGFTAHWLINVAYR